MKKHIALIVVIIAVLIGCLLFPHSQVQTDRHHYFVSYVVTTEISSYQGMAEQIACPEIRDYNDVLGMRESIRRSYSNKWEDPNVVILSWQELPGRK